jgi:endoglucanase
MKWKMRRPSSIAGVFASLSLLLGLGQSNAQQTDHAQLWQAYAAKFISADGRVVDPLVGGWTTSEGQSYALFFALVNNDRARFVKLLAWTESNLATGDLGTHLPAWSWGQGKDGRWGVLDHNSASDSDLWIAYDLIEAGRLWDDAKYAKLGRRLAETIAERETANLPGLGQMLLPGPTELFHHSDSWTLNPSYIPLFLLNRLTVVSPAGPWANIAATLPPLLERSSRRGFAMDWVCYVPTDGFSPCQTSGQPPPPTGSYDAIRVYLWAGMLADGNPAKARLLKALPGMNTYMQHSAAPPEKISADGTVQPQNGPVGFSAALLPYLEGYSNRAAVAQQLVRLKSQLDEKSHLYGSSPTYYDQNLILFGSGWIEKRFEFGIRGELLVRWSR